MWGVHVTNETRLPHLTYGQKVSLDSIASRLRRVHRNEESLEKARAYEDILTLLRLINWPDLPED